MQTEVITIVGARPQFVKAAAVSHAFRQRGDVKEFLVHTGQHYDDQMSGIFFRELGMSEPDVNLSIGSGPHGAQTGAMLSAIERLLIERTPKAVMVYGDTNSTLAGALAAAKLNIPVAHVEAGLRSFNPRMPEELNRVLTDALSGMLLAPTEQSVANLRREGYPDTRIHLVGDVMYDAALSFAERAQQQSRVLGQHGLTAKKYLLATVHRAATTDDPMILTEVFSGLIAAAALQPVVVPLHPRTRAALLRAGLLESVLARLQVIEPVGYLDMVQLEKMASLICTDSGGVQREAFYFQVPCITLRSETEWTETVDCGANELVGTGSRDIEAAVRRRLLDPREIPNPGPFYGNGEASRRIAQLIATFEDSIGPASLEAPR